MHTDFSSLEHHRLRAGRSGELATLVAIDDDACALFVQAGFDVDFPPEHPYTAAERSRWQRLLDADQVIVATSSGGTATGFAALDVVDGEAYLEQLSVRCAYMRRGLGAALIAAAVAAALRTGASVLWLTTYDHLAWNRPYYERQGFRCIADAECDAGLRATLEHQRVWLPYPRQRVAMRLKLDRRTTPQAI
jgi:GNAT superfamily N-acetyltransferase